MSTLGILAGLHVGCATGRNPAPDAPRPVDAGARDGGPDAPPPALDAGIDGGAMDAGGSDAGSVDAGADARSSDASGDVRLDSGRDAPTVDGGGYLPATWSTSASSLPCSPGTIHRYTCPPGGTAGSLWGTGEHTSDSSICTAAVHSGHITFAAGGPVAIAMRAGRSSYLGSSRNGVTSSSWGSYSCSFAVVEPACPGATCNDVCIPDPMTDAFGCGLSCSICTGGATCSAGVCGCPIAGQTSCGGTCIDPMTNAMHCGGCSMPCPATQVCSGGTCGCPAGRTLCPTTGDVCIDIQNDAGNCGGCGIACGPGLTCAASTCGAMAATWSTSATSHSCPADVGNTYTYGCPPGGTAGALWGTDVYTHDSSICTAAVHAGRISLSGGGAVTIEMAPGAASYTGSLRNGITSNSYGSWSCSFTFP